MQVPPQILGHRQQRGLLFYYLFTARKHNLSFMGVHLCRPGPKRAHDLIELVYFFECIVMCWLSVVIKLHD